MFFLHKKNIPLKEIIPQGFIDIHSHLIPGIDDGVKSEKEALHVIENYESLGVHKLITTPHIMQDVWPNESIPIKKIYEKLIALIKKESINVELKVAAEYMLDNLFLDRLANNDLLSFGRDHILVEISAYNPPFNLREILFKIKLAGFSPILAHPERYYCFQDNYKEYDLLKNNGFLFQINLLSLIGYYGRDVQNTGLKLLEDDLIDFVGTDVHKAFHLWKLSAGFKPKIASKIEPIFKKNALIPF